MTQRTLAGILAAPLLIALWVAAASEPLPYVTYEPGLTVNVLGDHDGEQIIQVDGHRTYSDGGQLRMTTVYVSQPRPAAVTLAQLMKDWVSRDDAIYPYDAIYQPQETQASNQKQGHAEMVSSQDAAAAAAMEELGYDVSSVLVSKVYPGTPAQGRLQVHDVIVKVDGAPVTSPEQVSRAVTSAGAGRPVHLLVRRDGRRTEVSVTPEQQKDGPRVGVGLSTALHFPFQVKVKIDPNIGGPSAGLMFSLGIYDVLTPGSLTDGETIAGTGTIDAAGNVGPIGGIQQKIAAARDAGAELFFVPPDNCQDALGGDNGDMRLVKASTMHDAVRALKTWTADRDAALPSCKEDS